MALVEVVLLSMPSTYLLAVMIEPPCVAPPGSARSSIPAAPEAGGFRWVRVDKRAAEAGVATGRAARRAVRPA